MKIKYILEYPLNCSPFLLFPRLSTPEGLSEWFADNVNIEGKYFMFFWDGTFQKAEVKIKKENDYVRFHWCDDEEESTFFEFRIMIDELTGDLALLITDFAVEEDKIDAIDLWNSQVSTLKHCVGV